jgi:hypothetical protein
VPDIAYVLEKRIRTSDNKLRIRLSSLNAAEPVSTSEITPYAPFGKYPIQECQLRLDGIPERDAEMHLPAALKVILRNPATRPNPDCLPNNHRSSELLTYEIRQTRYTPPTLVIGGLTLSKAAACVKTVRIRMQLHEYSRLITHDNSMPALRRVTPSSPSSPSASILGNVQKTTSSPSTVCNRYAIPCAQYLPMCTKPSEVMPLEGCTLK